MMHGHDVRIGIITGKPRVFLANPYPYPSKPVPVYMGTGYLPAGVRVISKPQGHNTRVRVYGEKPVVNIYKIYYM
jgi:hypothetical protein